MRFTTISSTCRVFEVRIHDRSGSETTHLGGFGIGGGFSRWIPGQPNPQPPWEEAGSDSGRSLQSARESHREGSADVDIPEQLWSDFDLLECPGGDIVVKLNSGVAAKKSSNELGNRLRDNQADRFGGMPPNQGTQDVAYALQRVFNRLTEGRADGQGLVEPLAKELGVSAAEFIDLETLPESLVQVAEFIEPFGPKPQGPADGFGGPEDALAWSAVKRDQIRSRQRFRERGNLGTPTLAEGDIEHPLDSILFVVDGGAGTDQEDLGHSCDGETAPGAATSPR